MGLKIADLLKWRTTVILLDQEDKPILDDDKNPINVYLRVIGDDDLEASHRAARLHSATIRKQLQDKTSDLYKDRVEPIMEASREDCESIVSQYRASNLESEARANVTRPDAVTLEEIAIDPDAATLEEQEKLDAAQAKQDEEYEAALKEYVDVRKAIIDAEIKEMSLDDLRTVAKEEIGGVIALSEFFNELMEQKLFRGAYTDKTYKHKAFDSIEEIKKTAPVIRQQLFDAYLELEFDPDKVKK
jgi:hypothetical protein